MSGRSYDTPPKGLQSLERRLQNIEDDKNLRVRARRQIGYMAVIAALRHNAKDERSEPLFVIKGGVAIELLMGLNARATKDLDASFRAAKEEIEPRMRDALAEGWDGFTFRLDSWEPIRDTGGHRGDVKISFMGRAFSTVQFEASPAEGESGQELSFVNNTFLDPVDLGLTPVPDIPLVTLAYLLAQKLPLYGPRRRRANERPGSRPDRHPLGEAPVENRGVCGRSTSLCRDLSAAGQTRMATVHHSPPRMA